MSPYLLCLIFDFGVASDNGSLFLESQMSIFHSFYLFGKTTVNLENFARVYFHMRSFVKIKPSRNGKITLSFTDIRISCPSREFLTSQICLLMLFAKINLSRKFPNLQYKIHFVLTDGSSGGPRVGSGDSLENPSNLAFLNIL